MLGFWQKHHLVLLLITYGALAAMYSSDSR